MARRSSLYTSLAKAARAAERERKAQIKREEKALKAAERAKAAYEKAQTQQIIADEKERKRLYVESRETETAAKNEQLKNTLNDLETVLTDTLTVDNYLDFESLKEKPSLPQFQPGFLDVPTRKPEKKVISELTLLEKMNPLARRRHSELVTREFELHIEATKKYERAEEERKTLLETRRKLHQKHVDEIKEKIAEQHSEIDEFKAKYESADPEAIIDYFILVLESSAYPKDFPQHAKVAYVAESKQLVIEYDLPKIDVVPLEKEYAYIKSKDEIRSKALPESQRRSLYSSVISQITLRTLHEIFEADRAKNIDTVVFNGFVDSIDLATGLDVRPCLVTVRTTRDQFEIIDLERVDPQTCLKGLNAAVSKKPEELAPVRPVLEFNMVDSRFVEETDIISELDNRQNLMELTPFEFENLISNLFQKMGLETRQTQSSRDGGVDCVAYDPRPIFGGKVIIQAKRYKGTVGVSAVRDLFGTLQNEGASKGILVTTSGYGKAAYEFADGKPIELLDGTNLLYLLAEHANIEAKIIVPEDWRDQSISQ